MYTEALELLGREWEKFYRPEDIRLNIEHLRLLLSVNREVGSGQLSAEDLESESPTFVLIYRAVMLRDVREHIPNDNEP